MKYRQFGRTDSQVSELGYGMWGMGSWSKSDDTESLRSLQSAVDGGCNFFDTAHAYGEGRSENLLGQLVRANQDKRLYTATKIPPKNQQWPARAESALEDCFPPDHIEEFVRHSLKSSGLESIDLIQLHVWHDGWLEDDRWARKLEDLRRQGLLKAIGISLNRWEPWNGVDAVNSGLVDAVQVIYNIFDQNPEDELFPACKKMNVAVIARVPFDEGTLTGTLKKDSKWPAGDWRNTYFVPENLIPSVERAEVLKKLLRDWNSSHPQARELTMPEMALRFILGNASVSTVIPGMRKLRNVQANIAAVEGGPLPAELQQELKKHRWVRKPAAWSQ